MKKHNRLAAILLSGCMLVTLGTAVPPVSVSSVRAEETKTADEVQKEKQETQYKKALAENKLKELTSAKEDILQVIADLDSEITGYETKIVSLTEEKNSFQVKAAVAETNLQTAAIRESNQYKSMKERIQYAYENGDTAYIEALMSIKDYSSITNQSEYVEQVSDYDQTQLDRLAAIEQEISSYKDTVETGLAKVTDLKDDAESEKAALQVMQNGKHDTLQQYNADISETTDDIADYEALEAQQDAAIAQIEAQAAAARQAAEAQRQAAAAAAQQAAAAQAAATTQAPAVKASGSDASRTTAAPATTQAQTAANTAAQTAPAMNSYSGGGFVWPMPTSHSIVSGFGPRVAPTAGASTYHKGVDIDCPSGSSVIAAASGVVTYTGYFGGGGNTVIIDHGNGLTTLYMHLSSYACSVGQNVSAGQVIAYSGSTGVATGPHLHFAVRSGGSYVNPLGYF